MGGRREVSIIAHRPVTSSDLKQERSSFRGSVSTLLQLVVVYFFSEQNSFIRKNLPTEFVWDTKIAPFWQCCVNPEFL